jgi:hypothetical protein
MKLAARSCWVLLGGALTLGLSSCVKRGSAPADAGKSGDGGPSLVSVRASAGHHLPRASHFDEGESVPWTTSFTAPADVASGVRVHPTDHSRVAKTGRHFALRVRHETRATFTTLATAPHEDERVCHLFPPSTAATPTFAHGEQGLADEGTTAALAMRAVDSVEGRASTEEKGGAS